jgi:hypothetical protein
VLEQHRRYRRDSKDKEGNLSEKSGYYLATNFLRFFFAQTSLSYKIKSDYFGFTKTGTNKNMLSLYPGGLIEKCQILTHLILN